MRQFAWIAKSVKYPISQKIRFLIVLKRRNEMRLQEIPFRNRDAREWFLLFSDKDFGDML